jgi:hypothetical protein
MESIHFRPKGQQELQIFIDHQLKIVEDLNKKKVDTLDNFHHQIKQGTITRPLSAYKEKILPDISAIGGRISGVFRRIRRETCLTLLMSLSESNPKFFENFTLASWNSLSALLFDFAPTRKTLVDTILKHPEKWKDKKSNHPSYSNIDFKKHLKTILGQNDTASEVTLIYQKIISQTQKTIQNNGNKAREKLKEIKFEL